MVRFFKRGSAKNDAEPAPVAKKSFDEIKPDPDKIGISGSVPFVRLPEPGSLFKARSERLLALAPGHTLEAYLRLVAEIARAQAVVEAERAAAGWDVTDPDEAGRALRVEHGMPPLSRHVIEADPSFHAGLDGLLDALDLSAAPDQVRAARDGLRAASKEDRSTSRCRSSRARFPSSGWRNACSSRRRCRSASPAGRPGSTPRR